MNIVKTPIDEVFIIENSPYADHRGNFRRLFCDKELADVLGSRKIVQINHSSTFNKGCVRGLHFQFPPYSEMKLIRCMRGEIFDVAVDLRKNSKTFMHWYGVHLDSGLQRMIVIPEGVAHGFQTLNNDCELIYLHTNYHDAKSEGGINPLDPAIAINWPIAITEMSERDSLQKFLDNDFPGIVL